MISQYRITTSKPIALDSPDHLHPFGTAADNSICPAFNRKLFELVPAPVVLDLGCAGGGFVKSVIDDGGDAVGIEGSDYSLKSRRAEWSIIPERLFTADITQPFTIERDGAPAQFNVITAWEVLEHIREQDLPVLFENIRRHLTEGGLVIVSISTVPCPHEGVELHQNVNPEGWWLLRFFDEGLAHDEPMTKHFGRDWMRQDCWDTSLYAVFVRHPYPPL